jgi:hypothetical protein
MARGRLLVPGSLSWSLWRFSIVARPEMIQCEVCGVDVEVAARGRIPRFCADHRGGVEADSRPDSGSETDEQAESVDEESVEAVVVVDDGWPQQVAPIVWVDQDGRRYTDHGDAERGAREIRERDG